METQRLGEGERQKLGRSGGKTGWKSQMVG